jgi:hypothetical protein
MKIAFGLDGTVWSYQRTFRLLQHLLQKSGHSVGVLTAHSAEIQNKDRHLLKERGFAPFDFFICRTAENILEDEAVDSWKLRMLAQHDIDLLFDDCDNNNDGTFQEMLDSGRVITIEPRLPLQQHYQ